MKKTIYSLIGIILGAFIIRLVCAINADQLLSSTLGTEQSFSPDSASYMNHALNLLNGKGYGFGSPTITHGWFQAPGYPVFIYLVYKFVARSLSAIKIAQAVLDSLAVLIIFLIAKEIFTVRVAIISSIIYSLYPYFILQCLYINSECLFTLLYALSIFFMLKLIAHKTKFEYLFCAGLFMAAAALTRTTVALFLPFVGVWLFLFFRKRRILLLRFGVVFLIFCLMISPWIIYSFSKTGRFIPISTTGVVMFWVGNSKFGAPYIFSEEFNPKLREEFLEDFYSKDDVNWFIKEASAFIKNTPFLYLKMRFYSFLNFWRILPKVRGRSLLRILINFISVTVIPLLGILGIIKSHRFRNKNISFLLVSFIFFTLLHTVSLGIVRYRIPLIDPYLIIFASYFISKIFHLDNKVEIRSKTVE